MFACGKCSNSFTTLAGRNFHRSYAHGIRAINHSTNKGSFIQQDYSRGGNFDTAGFIERLSLGRPKSYNSASR